MHVRTTVVIKLYVVLCFAYDCSCQLHTKSTALADPLNLGCVKSASA